MKILLTGASGFIGRSIANSLSKENDLLCVSRGNMPLRDYQVYHVEDIGANTDWSVPLEAIDVVVHLAAIAHNKSSSEIREVNVAGTEGLVRQSLRAGVKRFIFLSSIGVNGNFNERPFTADDRPSPADSYALSKLEAEERIESLCAGSEMDFVIIRPPMVYGPGSPGSFGRLMHLVKSGFFLPLGSISNSRSLISIYNLVDFVEICLDHKGAANQVFLVSDNDDVSTSDLIRLLSSATGRRDRLFPMPASMLFLLATLMRKKNIAHGLVSSLRVDISKARDLLGWEPRLSLRQGILRCFDNQEML